MINKTHPITEKLLKNGLNLSLKLLDLLTKEADTLNHTKDPVSLTKIAAGKKETVTQLNQFSKQLTQVLSTEKLQMTPEDIAKYLKKAEKVNLNTTNSTRHWQQILSVSEQCRQLNEKNGASINLLMQHTQRSLHILKGKPQQQPTTYGADGSTHRELFSQPLVSV